MEYQPIIRLSDEVIGQIAAGEVVERPAAAVKELVENSIDAGATAVTVELKDGGVSYIRVSDNGRGIPAGQMKMAFERHATSKLKTAEDLFSVSTLGFRGEALASIAAIAKVTCVSRTVNAEYGIKAQVEAGVIVDLAEAASPVGTTVTVRDLFFNAPVRLKFLKKATAEAALVSDYITRLILSRPDVAFRFVNQGKTVYRSAGDGTLESAIYCVYGREALRAMRPVHGSENGLLLDGYVGVGDQTRGNRLQQSFFINGRYFRNEMISKALESGCEGYVMIGRYPSCALMLTLPYRQVDVNVHPNKLEVRFQNPELIANAVDHLTREALRTVTIQDALLHAQTEPKADETDRITLQPMGSFAQEPLPAGEREPMTTRPPVFALGKSLADSPAHAESPATLREPSAVAHNAMEELLLPQSGRLISEMYDAPEADRQSHTAQPLTDNSVTADEMLAPNATAMYFTKTLSPAYAYTTAGDSVQTAISHAGEVQEMMPAVDTRASLLFIGIVFKTYLLFETGERLLMVDQHAAHERILYDRFMQRYQGTAISQHLLTPQVIRLTARDVTLLNDLNETLTDAGFELETFDATSVAVRAIPTILGESVPVRELLLDVLDETQTQRGKITRERLRRRVMQMACKHAIKAGDTLRREDVQALLEQMLETGAQPTCPHGRPIVSEFTRKELEKRFKRIP